MSKQHAPKDQKAVLTSVVVLAVATIAGLAVVATVASHKAKFAPASKASIVNLRGKTVCLPKEDTTGPQTQECAYGLKVSDDIHYALADLETRSGGKPFRTGDLVTVTGTLSPTGKDSVYDTVGIIEVDDIKLQQ